MTDAARLRALALAATPGPWECRKRPEFDGQLFPHDVVHPEGDAELGNWMMAERVRRKEDAEFIAAAHPQAVLALLAELETLRDDIANIRGEKWSAIELAIAHGKAADLWQSLHGVTSLDALLERAETAEAELETSRAQVEGMRKALDALLHVCEREDPEQAIAPREMELARSLLTPASPGEDIDDG